MLSEEEFNKLALKEKMMYSACLTVYENNYSIRQGAYALDIAPTTMARWLANISYIDKDLYDKLRGQLRNRKKSF